MLHIFTTQKQFQSKEQYQNPSLSSPSHHDTLYQKSKKQKYKHTNTHKKNNQQTNKKQTETKLVVVFFWRINFAFKRLVIIMRRFITKDTKKYTYNK